MWPSPAKQSSHRIVVLLLSTTQFGVSSFLSEDGRANIPGQFIATKDHMTNRLIDYSTMIHFDLISSL